jgi:hypothetical protein
MARRFGYSRVSTSDQDWSLQLEALTKAGVDDRDIFREKASGAKRDRSELRRMLDLLRPGDQATVYRLDHHIQGTSSGHDAARRGSPHRSGFHGRRAHRCARLPAMPQFGQITPRVGPDTL